MHLHLHLQSKKRAGGIEAESCSKVKIVRKAPKKHQKRTRTANKSCYQEINAKAEKTSTRSINTPGRDNDELRMS